MPRPHYHLTPRLLLRSSPWRSPAFTRLHKVLPLPLTYSRRRSRTMGDEEAIYTAKIAPEEATWYFKNAVGLELTEDTHLGFVGYVHEISIDYKGVQHTVSYGDLTTAVWRKRGELIANGDFEDSTLTDWTVSGSGASLDTGSNMRKENSVKFNKTNGAPYVYQDVDVLANETYRVSFMYDNQGTKLYLRIYDKDNASYIRANALVDANLTTYPQRGEVDFITPTGCTEVRIDFNTLNAGDCFLDDVSMKRINRSETVHTYDGPSMSNLQMWGRIESILDCGDASKLAAESLAFTHLAENKNPKRTAPRVSITTQADDQAVMTIIARGYSHTRKWKILVDGTEAIHMNLASAMHEILGELDHITVVFDYAFNYDVSVDPRDGEMTVEEAFLQLLPADARWQRRESASATKYIVEPVPENVYIYRRGGRYYHDPSATNEVNPFNLPTAFRLKDLDFAVIDDRQSKLIVERYEANDQGNLHLLAIDRST